MKIDLAGKRAIVAGGSRGIGRAIALALAEAGAGVSICARGAERLAATREEIARHDRPLAGQIDVHVIAPQNSSECSERDRLYHADDPAVRVAAVRACLAACRSMTK